MKQTKKNNKQRQSIKTEKIQNTANKIINKDRQIKRQTKNKQKRTQNVTRRNINKENTTLATKKNATPNKQQT